MRVALRHRERLVTHEVLDAVQVGPGQGQPGGEGMPQAVKRQAVAAVSDAVVEADARGHVVEGVGEPAFFAPARIEQARRACLAQAGQDRHGLVIERDFASGFAAGVAHGEHAVGDVHILAGQPLDFAQAQAGVHGQDRGGAQKGRVRGRVEEAGELLAGEKPLPGVIQARQADARDGVAAVKKTQARQMVQRGAHERQALPRGGRGARGQQLVTKALDVPGGDLGRQQVAKTREDVPGQARVVVPGGQLVQVGPGQVVRLDQGAVGLDTLGGRRRFLLAALLGQGPALGQGGARLALGVGRVQLSQDAGRALGRPALAGPAQALLGQDRVAAVPDAVVQVRPTPEGAAGVLAISDARIGSRVFLARDAGPTLAPLLFQNEGTLEGRDKRKALSMQGIGKQECARGALFGANWDLKSLVLRGVPVRFRLRAPMISVGYPGQKCPTQPIFLREEILFRIFAVFPAKKRGS